MKLLFYFDVVIDNFFVNYILNMNQTTTKQSLYNQKIRSLFTQLICETESLYVKVVREQYSNVENTEAQSVNTLRSATVQISSFS